MIVSPTFSTTFGDSPIRPEFYKKAFNTLYNSSCTFSSSSSDIILHIISNQVSSGLEPIPGHERIFTFLCFYSLFFLLSLNILTLPLLSNFLSDKTLSSRQSLTPMFWKQTSCLDVNSDIYQIPNLSHIMDIFDTQFLHLYNKNNNFRGLF